MAATSIPQSSKEQVALAPENGVVKEIISKGTGRGIEPGDILAIQYQASILGANKPFAKGDKEQFIFKDGSHIKGWDIAVGSMKIGEKSRFVCKAQYAYGAKGIDPVIPPDSDVVVEMNLLAWLGNQMRPESLFQKDLDIDPFIASTPETIQAEFDEMTANKEDKYKGGIVQLYLNRFKNISFGFGGSNFFASQSGERPPWYLNPNITFPSMVAFTMGLFFILLNAGGLKEKGQPKLDLEIASSVSRMTREVV
jgi:hypothetical protein